jgi:uncharacterized protein YndB with AHSA1/START domain
MNRRWLLPLVAALLVFLPAAVNAAPIRTFDQKHVHVVVSSEPKRVEWDVTIPGSPDAVWDAVTTQAGLISWLAPMATVDPRPGGDWLVSFPGGPAPAGGTIVELQPKAFIAIAAMAPGKYPTVRKERTYALFTFAPVGTAATRVHLTQTGWRDGEEWDAAMDYLAGGNAQLLEALYQRFAAGPIQWGK